MKYNVVALLDENSSSEFLSIQKNLSRKYKLYKNISNLYIPLGTVYNVEFEKLDEVITKIISPYKKFRIGVGNNLVINDNTNTVSLSVEDKGYINKITRNIFDTLDLHGVNIKDCSYSTSFKMPLSNANNNIRKALSNDTLTIDSSKNKDDIISFGKINKIEIWKQVNNKKEVLIKSYVLKDY